MYSMNLQVYVNVTHVINVIHDLTTWNNVASLEFIFLIKHANSTLERRNLEDQYNCCVVKI
jgi:hypothetical protein